MSWNPMQPAPSGAPADVFDREVPCDWQGRVEGAWCREHIACQATFDQMLDEYGGEPCVECGVATNDPLHFPYHKIIVWNKRLRDDARRAHSLEYERKLALHDRKRGRTAPRPQGDLGITLEPTRNTYSRPF
jgi:hypothetical protein